ncbi:MFS transporter [Rhodococcus rhodochrous]|uniref:MFS transporter n=1 Tax=Rhodococcus rhodochrous KG-21 TaxID=1441923 RepID=A0A0M8PRJ5_RHORH|nr:MFS transporter [Rhodococcus rhodochrous]KOS57659.1 MFS transporter [Rhodococcus rhodochrous KG-21]
MATIRTPSPTATTSDVNPPGYTRRRALAVLVMIVFFMIINFGDKAVLGLAAVPIMSEFRIDRSMFGLIASSFYLLYSIAGIVVGFVSARVSSRLLLFSMAMMWTVAQIPVLLVATVPALVAGRVLLGAAEGPATPMSMHALYKWFPPHKRGLPSALQISGAALGVLIAAPLLTWLISDHGWRAAFIALAVVSGLWGIAWLAIGKDGPFDRDTRHGHGAATGKSGAAGNPKIWKILVSGTFLGSAASAFGGHWAMAVNSAWLPEYLHTTMQFGPGDVAGVISVISGTSLVLLLTISPLSDLLLRKGLSVRWAHGALQGIAVTIAGIAMVLVPFADGSAIRLVLIVIAFSGSAVAFPLHYMTAAAVVPPAKRGAVFGILAATGTLPGLVAPYVTGRIVDGGATVVAGYGTAFTLAAVVMIACGVYAVAAIRPAHDAHRLSRVGTTGTADDTTAGPA